MRALVFAFPEGDSQLRALEISWYFVGRGAYKQLHLGSKSGRMVISVVSALLNEHL